MATDKPTTSFPKISKRIWLGLRAKFAKSLPSTVTPDYIISIADMTPDSAKTNVLSPLRLLGILDKDNKPTDLAERWRHDEEYKQVCDEIRASVYPVGLLEAHPEGRLEEHAQIKKWFARNSKVGDDAAKKFADVYILLSQADLSALEVAPPKPKAPKKIVATSKAAAKAPNETAAVAQVPPPAIPDHPGERLPTSRGRLPSVHIDVQVHISPDTTPEQIDRIFESMSKHLGTYIS